MSGDGASTRRLSVAYPEDWPVFQGHLPGRPLVPGAELIRRAAALIGGTLLEVVRFGFSAPLLPGEVAEIEATPTVDGQWKVRISRGDRLCASGTLRMG